MYTREQAKQEILASLKKHIGKGFELTVGDLNNAEEKFGDISFTTFELAKNQKRNPVELATELAAKIGPSDLIAKIESVGPYINFKFNNKNFIQSVIDNVDKTGKKFGNSDLGKGTSIIVDYAQPNTHKEFHVGHIRSSLYGQSVINVARANGYKVIGASYIGDIGAHVAKALWGMEKFHKGEVFEKSERVKKMGEIYTEATKYVAEHEYAKEEIAEVLQKLEAGDSYLTDLWKQTREWSLDSFKEIFKELNIHPDVWYFESDVEKTGKKLVQKMLTDGIAKKSQGATIVDLEDEGLGAFLILKSDDSSLYATKDLSLAFQKDKKYKADRQIFVVDIRQSLYFKQLFATLKKMGFTKQLTHLAFDFVNLPEGAMSSRSGNIVTYTDLRDDMRKHLEKETKDRHEDWSEKKIKSTASTIALASMSFMMLRQDPESIITFDIEEAMSFEGFTGPYILYTIARIESIKAKAKVKAKFEAEKLTNALEQRLIRKLALYPEIVQNVGKNFKVSNIAIWSFEISKLFNEYYHQVKIVDENNKDYIASRIALIEAVRQGLENAMSLLCIDVLKEM